ncbi:YdcF family protein [Limnohabitans sp. JirII-31]|uniref:YdcF family protein n=1 Tax=Limnohabitans sp. JirII-31 TaxID=1977908 RepID=UPI000C1EFB1A|nr:YdcF family protein [Limnohabitans sp. JirII-31]PIT73837.1 hypothetical protein B9Z41_14150 [Limnohabitans sp. JirII-31]
MDTLLALKPLLTTLILPTASGLLLMALMLLWAWRRHAHKRPSSVHLPVAGGLLTCAGLWLLSCPAVALWLSLHLLPQVKPATPEALLRHKVQAIVVLGGGVEQHAPEYDGPNLPPESMARLLYGMHLAQTTHLPLGYTGGIGWAGAADQTPEAQVAAHVLARLHGPALRWQESLSRDTRENAQLTAALLRQDGVQRIALVTHAWHMPRSVRQFEAAGLDVTPAPMGYVHSDLQPLLQWLPHAFALRDSTSILREWLGLRLT